MSYIEHSLAQSERLIYRAHFPWFYPAAAWALLIGTGLGGSIAYANGYAWIGLGLLLAGLASFAVLMVPLWTTEIGVTNQRFIYKRGWLWRATQELQLRAIEEVNLEQGLLAGSSILVGWNFAGPASMTSVCRRLPTRLGFAGRCRTAWLPLFNRAT